MLKIQLEELEIFVAAVNSGNFSKAAEVLGVTASVVSRTVMKLEAKLSTTLFNRTTRKISITQEGEWLFANAQNMLADANKIESFLRTKDREPEGSLVVDAATPFSLHALSPLIRGFNQQYPKVRVSLQSNESNIDLLERRIDLAIRIGELQDSSLKCRKIGVSYRKLYASPDYLKLHSVPHSADDLREHACLGFIKPEKLNTWPVRLADKFLEITPDTLADSGETLKQLAINGCGIACLSSFTVQTEVQAGRLLQVLETETVLQPVPIYAVFYSDNEVNSRLRCFIDYISEHIQLS
ncbi:LysR family transcriptional regulator [Aliamphritea ceti]|uniref:LysR family transcriptional regulator n=1 Tax=Aliamphritea ceti TaxID=1524258 RepID=UPI0021C2FF6D|nr:LysR family transcriptional regulator [Aliamphritea ceti]